MVDPIREDRKAWNVVLSSNKRKCLVFHGGKSKGEGRQLEEAPRGQTGTI